MKLFMVRHGQTPNNLNKLYTGQTDVPLTELGRQQAQAIAPALSKFTFNKVFSSDLQRAVDTQKLALPGIVGTLTPLLRELSMGSLEGQPLGLAFADGNEERRRNRDYRIFGGECGSQAQDRLTQFLKTLEQDPCDYAIAFTHGGMINTMLRYITQSEVNLGCFKNGNCGIQVFEYDGQKWSLLAWNYMKEL